MLPGLDEFVHRCGYIVDIAGVADLVQERDVMIEGIDLIPVVLEPDPVQEGNVNSISLLYVMYFTTIVSFYVSLVYLFTENNFLCLLALTEVLRHQRQILFLYTVN